MATTISFTSAGFTAGLIDRPGTNDVQVVEVAAPNGGFELFAQDGTPIVNLGLEGDDSAQNLLFTSDDPIALVGLTANLGGGDDTLIIGGQVADSRIRLLGGNDNIFSDGEVRNSDIRTNFGDDTAIFESETFLVARDSRILMGKGNDTLIFGGSVQNIDTGLGLGSDNVEFQGNIQGARLNLAGTGEIPDGEVDTVRLSATASIEGLVITGADDNDLLFIGTTQYNYDSANNLWVNSTNPNDTRNFS